MHTEILLTGTIALQLLGCRPKKGKLGCEPERRTITRLVGLRKSHGIKFEGRYSSALLELYVGGVSAQMYSTAVE